MRTTKLTRDLRSAKPGEPGGIDGPLIASFDATIPPVRRVTTALARRFHQICLALVADTVRHADLTPLQYGVLGRLSKQNGEPGIDQISLAGRLGVDRNTSSKLIDQLEARGLLERRVDRIDRRARQLYLTPKGQKVYDRLLPANLAANDRILAPLAPHERDMFLDFLVRVIEGNWVHARPGAGRRKLGSDTSAPSKRSGQSASPKP